MSQTQKTPVSEVIGNTESFIHRVIDIRRRAAELSEQAARLQEEAYLAAVRDLGPEDGPMAFSLACRGLGVDPSLRSGVNAPLAMTEPVVAISAVVVQPVAVQAVPAPVTITPQAPSRPSVPTPEQAESGAVAPFAAPAAPRVVARPVQAPEHSVPAVPPLAEQDDPSRLVRYGVAIKRSKLTEAEEVIDQARRTAAQNRKSNPYSDDRGRNAWRNTLFAAVLSAESGSAEQSAPVAEQPVIPVADEAIAETAALSEPEIHDVDDATDASPLEEAFPVQEEPADQDVFEDGIEDPNDDDVLDDAPPLAEAAAPATAPVLPSRAVAFTNNLVQSAPQPAPETRAPAQPPVARQPSPFARAVPAAAPSPSTEVHVDRPVTNRTFAHGQAVPMPKSLKEAIGLKETIKKIDDEKPSTPTIAPPPLRKAPSFIPR